MLKYITLITNTYTKDKHFLLKNKPVQAILVSSSNI